MEDESQTVEQAIKITNIVSVHTSKSANGTPIMPSKRLKILKDDALLIKPVGGCRLDYIALSTDRPKAAFLE